MNKKCKNYVVLNQKTQNSSRLKVHSKQSRLHLTVFAESLESENILICKTSLLHL